MNHIYVVPYTLQNVLSTSSHWIFEQLRELSVISFPLTEQPREMTELTQSHVTCTWRRWVLNPGVGVSKPQVVFPYQESTSVCKKSDSLPDSSLAYDYHVILMYVFSVAVFHTCLQCPCSFLSSMVSMCDIGYLALKYGVLKKATTKLWND